MSEYAITTMGLPVSKAEEVHSLFKKYKKLIFKYEATADFKEPVLLLIRESY